MPNPSRPRVPLSQARAALLIDDARRIEAELSASPDRFASDLARSVRRGLEARFAPQLRAAA